MIPAAETPALKGSGLSAVGAAAFRGGRFRCRGLSYSVTRLCLGSCPRFMRRMAMQ